MLLYKKTRHDWNKLQSVGEIIDFFHIISQQDHYFDDEHVQMMLREIETSMQ